MATITNIVLKKIIKLRKQNGYSQASVAAALMMSQTAYSELELGKKKLDLERLRKIAALYQTNIHHLLEDIPGQ